MLITLLEETLTEFLSKATGTAVDWVQMPGMKIRLGSLPFHIDAVEWQLKPTV
ncbi:hypothetical protein ACSBR2_030617 [Camellia fascicularis]